MRQFLHSWWPVAAVVLFTTTLVLQIPRKALFFHPVSFSPPEPFVSFVELDDAAYARLVRRIRMAWQIRSRPIVGAIAAGRTDNSGFSVSLPPPAYLPRRGVTTALTLPPVSAALPPALLPPSFGLEMPPAPSVAPSLDRDPDLLAMPEDHASYASPQPDFTLKKPRSIK